MLAPLLLVEPNKTDSRLFWRFFLSPFVVPFSQLPLCYQAHSSQDCPWESHHLLALSKSVCYSKGSNTTFCASPLWCTSHDFLASTRPSLTGHFIRSNLPYLSRSKPGMNFYFISQMTFAHLTSNSMLCDSTFLCPGTLFSSPISSWLGSPQPKEATQLSLFQPPGVYKEPELGQNHQSHLCRCLDNTSPRPAFISTSTAASGCSMPRLRGRSCVTLLMSTKRTADFHSQVTLPLKTCSRVTVDFHSQVN